MEKIDLEYLEEKRSPEETPPQHFATVGAVYADGLSLIFDGETEPTAKHYRCNTSVYFKPGDRVRIFPDSGTYVVEYVVGAPMQQPVVGIPAGGANNTVLTKQSTTDYDATWRTPNYVPTSGTVGYVLTKTSNGASFQAVPSSLPSGGSTGQVLKKTSSGAAWGDETQELPSGGSNGQVLAKTNSGVAWGDLAVKAYSGTILFYVTNTELGVSTNGGSSYKWVRFE